MVAILKYVLLGIFLYVAVIPILEELATVIVQGLEVVKGKFVIMVANLQEKVEKRNETKTHAIGFAIPADDEEDDEEDFE